MRLHRWIFIVSISCAAATFAQVIAAPPATTKSASAAAPLVAHGADLFRARCASCHDPAIDRAPSKTALARRFPDDIATALKSGVMQPMAADLSDEDIHSIATYLGADGMTEQAGDPPACSRARKFSLYGPGWNGWSIDARNSRLQPDPGISAADVPRFKVKWSMTYTGGRYGQPIIAGGRLFLTSSSGRIYSWDAKTGCMHWRFDADAGVRTTPVVGQLQGAAPSGYSIFFGDFQRNVYVLDAASGKLQWKMNLENHPRSVLTGAPVLYKGLLYVPISSWEETVGGVGSYGCCTARGGLAALDAKRAVVYIGTGDTYTDVKENGSDAIIALDLVTGKVRWRNQVTEKDSFLMGCSRSGIVNCPTIIGPDHDFGASPTLFSLPNGKDIILAGQKSGVVFGMDPDNDGKTLWRNKVGNGGALGGIEWGMAADAKQLYVAVADLGMPPPRGKAGLYALDPTSGEQRWNTSAPKAVCSYSGRCLIGQSAAPSVIPGLVLSTTIDGIKDQSGGSLDVAGPVLAGGMMYIISGYAGALGGAPNNVLLVFSIDGK